ncbi:MAG TPA: hypothetical protein PLM29_09890 [Deltaproteobacteria bacterium]|nr:hypothetical protein [Deltaproteobacteria bacterium]
MHDLGIRKDMTVLDVVSEHKGTDKVFSSYDIQAGECICCNSLFETIEAVARKYKIDLESLIHDLEKEISRKK